MSNYKKIMSLGITLILLFSQSGPAIIAVTVEGTKDGVSPDSKIEKTDLQITPELSSTVDSFSEYPEDSSFEPESTEDDFQDFNNSEVDEINNQQLSESIEMDSSEEEAITNESDEKSNTPSIEEQVNEVEKQENETKLISISFVVGDSIHDSQEIEQNTVPSPPQIPSSQGKSVFVGWYIVKGNKEEFYNFTTPLVEDTELVAKFRESYAVMFKVDGQIVYTGQSEPGQPIVEPISEEITEALQVAAGDNVFSYWYDESDPSEKQIIFGVDKISTDMVLVPKFSDRYTVTFITNGDPLKDESGKLFPNPQLVDKGGKITKPPLNPERKGYKFKYWSLDPSGAVEFDFSSQKELSQNTVLYAIYEADEGVSFYIQYWNEKANITEDAGNDHANYTAMDKVFIPFDSREWPNDIKPLPDEKIELPTEVITKHTTKVFENKIKNSYSKFSHYESKVLSSTGDTVINVFYKRIPQELKFNGMVSALQHSKFNLVSEGETFEINTSEGNKEWVLKAKIGEKLDKKWPIVDNDSLQVKKSGKWVESDFYAWNGRNIDGKTWVTKRLQMESSYSGGAVNLVTKEMAKQKKYLYYMKSITDEELSEIKDDLKIEKYNNVNYVEIPELTEELPGSIIESLGSKELSGMETVSGFKRGPKGYTTASGWFPPIEYYRVLYNTNTVSLTKGFESDYISGKPEVISKPAGAVLSEKDLKPVPDINGKIFDGWYWDSDFKPGTEVVPGDKMPDEDTHIHVKWKSIEKYKVLYFRNETDEQPIQTDYYNDGDFTSGVEGYEIGRPDPLGELGSFVGWFYEVSPGLWMPFKQSIPIYSHYKIVARWQVNNLHLTYDSHESVGGKWTNDSQYVDENNYSLGADAIVSKEAHTFLIPPDKMVFSGWRLGFDGAVYFPGNALSMLGDQVLVADYAKKDAKKLKINIYEDDNNKQTSQTIELIEDRETNLPMTWNNKPSQENSERELKHWIDKDGNLFNLGSKIKANDFLDKGITELDLYGYWEGILKLNVVGLNEYSFKLGDNPKESIKPDKSSTKITVTDSRQKKDKWIISVSSNGFTPNVSIDKLALTYKGKRITNSAISFASGDTSKSFDGKDIHLFLNENYTEWISSIPYRSTLNWSITSTETKSFIDNPGIGTPKKVGDDNE